MKRICTILTLVFILAVLPQPAMVLAGGYLLEAFGEAIPQEDGYLLVAGLGPADDDWGEILLYIHDAEIYDLHTGLAIEPEDIYGGDSVRVVYEPALNNSGRAVMVYLHAGEIGAADFVVEVSDNIWYSNEGCVFVTSDGKYRIILDENTLLLDDYGYEMSFDEIVPGMEMFVWASFVTASFPGQVVPDKIVLLRD